MSASPKALYRHGRRLFIGIAGSIVSTSPTSLYRHRRRLFIDIAGSIVLASPTDLYRHRHRLYISALPTALYQHSRQLCIGIAGSIVSASTTALYRHRRRDVLADGYRRWQVPHDGAGLGSRTQNLSAHAQAHDLYTYLCTYPCLNTHRRGCIWGCVRILRPLGPCPSYP